MAAGRRHFFHLASDCRAEVLQEATTDNKSHKIITLSNYPLWTPRLIWSCHADALSLFSMGFCWGHPTNAHSSSPLHLASQPWTGSAGVWYTMTHDNTVIPYNTILHLLNLLKLSCFLRANLLAHHEIITSKASKTPSSWGLDSSAKEASLNADSIPRSGSWSFARPSQHLLRISQHVAV